MGILEEVAASRQQPSPEGQVQEGQAPVEGQAPAQGGADMNVDALVKQATEILYSNNFENMVDMFEKYGKERFHEAMGTAINTTIERLEKDTGQTLPVEVAAEVGMAIFEMLLSDLHEGGVLPQIDKNDVLTAIKTTMSMWVRTHRDSVDPQEVDMAIQQMAQQLQGGAAQAAQPQQPAQAAQPPVQPTQGV